MESLRTYINRGNLLLLVLLLFGTLYTCARNKARRLVPPASVQTVALDVLVEDEAQIEASTETESTSETNSHSQAQEVLEYAMQFLGRPYKYGGTNEQGFDCSGFTLFVYQHFGYKLPHNSLWQFEQVLHLHADELRPGDLVFFAGSKGGNDINHVGIVTEVKDHGEFQFIHAASTGIVLSESRQTYYAERYIGGGRVIK